MATTVQQRRRTKGWRKPEGSVIVDRTSRWGNWWIVWPDDSGERGGWWVGLDEDSEYDVWHPTRSDAIEAAVARYRHDVTSTAPTAEARWVRDHVAELTGKTLLCWCPQPGPCHAHVLAALADGRIATGATGDPAGDGGGMLTGGLL